MSRASTHLAETERSFLALEFEAQSDLLHHDSGVHVYAYAGACSRGLRHRAMPVFFYVCVRPPHQVLDYRASASGEFGDGADDGDGVLKIPPLCPDPSACGNDPGSCLQPIPSRSLREPCWQNCAASGSKHAAFKSGSKLLHEFSDV